MAGKTWHLSVPAPI